MARCFCCVVGLLCIWVIAVSGSDVPHDADAPVPIKRYVPKPSFSPQPLASPQPTPIVTATAAAAPLATAPAHRESDLLTPVQHLRRAAEHLEAAAVGPLADKLCEQAAELRQTADRLERETAERLADLKQQLARIQAEIDKLEQLTVQSEQVQVSIKMIEVDPAHVDKLGLTFRVASDPQTDLIEKFVTKRNGQMLPTVVPAEAVEGLLEALRRAGAVRVLAAPEIVTMSGRPATIHSGGEFPVPVPQGDGTINMEWREFGIRAEVVPEIQENGRLKLDVAPEVSERDYCRSIKLGDHIVPGVTTRRINTQVEMDFGQTLVVGGMTSRTTGPADCHEEVAQAVGVPVPGKERVFRQVAHEVPPREKALLVLVTPRRVPRLEP